MTDAAVEDVLILRKVIAQRDAEIAALTAERDAALARVEELETQVSEWRTKSDTQVRRDFH